jgi:hypothetical protein
MKTFFFAFWTTEKTRKEDRVLERTKLNTWGCNKGKNHLWSWDGGSDNSHRRTDGCLCWLGCWPVVSLTHTHTRTCTFTHTHAQTVVWDVLLFPDIDGSSPLSKGTPLLIHHSTQFKIYMWLEYQLWYFTLIKVQKSFCTVYLQTEEQVGKYFVGIINLTALPVSL